MAKPRLISGVVVLAATVLGTFALAQQPPQPSARPQGPGPSKTSPAPKDSGVEAGLRQRVEQLEEQLVDMQVVVGTLESLARGATASASPSGRANPGAAAALDASDAGRLDGLETQIRAMAAQLEQLQEQVRALGGRAGAIAPSSAQASNDPAPPPGRPGRPSGEGTLGQPARPGFGTVTVSPPADRDEIGRILGPPSGAQVAAGPPMGGPPDGDAKQLYETAYGYLLQRDYGAAETAFDEFLSRHPNDPLAGNAQYWLGETYYVRGQYRAAANAFLKGYQSYARSAKAPESLLKLAMSLHRLGQKDAACSSYSELSNRFPTAPTHVKNTALAERQRAGC